MILISFLNFIINIYCIFFKNTVATWFAYVCYQCNSLSCRKVVGLFIHLQWFDLRSLELKIVVQQNQVPHSLFSDSFTSEPFTKLSCTWYYCTYCNCSAHDTLINISIIRVGTILYTFLMRTSCDRIASREWKLSMFVPTNRQCQKRTISGWVYRSISFCATFRVLHIKLKNYSDYKIIDI